MATANVNGVELQVSVTNEGGPRGLALLLHGFPELAFSWRHQIPALAEAGYEVWHRTFEATASRRNRRRCRITR